MLFRPHHFLCTLGFKGKGYSPKFVDNFQAIADSLGEQGGDDVVIQVTGESDSICKACPHQLGPICGSHNELIISLDKRHGGALNLKPGDKITWGQAKKLIASNLNEETFNEICEGCSWKNLGVCLDALKRLAKSE